MNYFLLVDTNDYGSYKDVYETAMNGDLNINGDLNVKSKWYVKIKSSFKPPKDGTI